MADSPLNEYEAEWLRQGRELKLGDPPPTWRRGTVVPAAGIMGCGWTQEDHLLLWSLDGYSVTDISTGERLISHLDGEYDLVESRLHADELHFDLLEWGQTINTFSINAGDGVHFTEDGWRLQMIYPWWPQEIVTIYHFPEGRYDQTWRNIYGIRLDHLVDHNLKCGFSPSGLCFVIMGHAGAEVFTRDGNMIDFDAL